jgi:transposase
MDDLLQSLGISDEDWAQTPPSVQIVVRVLVRITHDLQVQQQAQVAQSATLQQEVADLRALLAQHSGNSSKPPSSDPPSAPPRPSKTPRGRARGGQVGHPGHHRPQPLPEQIDEISDHHPTACAQCARPLTPADATGNYQERYVWEIPPIRPHITQHRLHQGRCPHCQHLTVATPRDLPPGQFGARVIALLALLHGRFRLSDREIVALGSAVFGLHLSPATVVTAQQQTSQALAPIYDELRQVLPEQPHLHSDETSWKEAGARRWLWVLVAPLLVVFHVAANRSRPVLHRLIGSNYAGILSSDRLAAYNGQPPDRRQLCWAHLLRNLLALSERVGTRDAIWAVDMLAQVAVLFALWRRLRDGQIDRALFQAAIAPVQASMRLLIEREACHYGRAATLAQELQVLWPALWTFVVVDGVEPTNNRAEQALRPAVLWRKGCFGAASESGNHFVERFLTVSATCQAQQQDLWTFLMTAIEHAWVGRPAPSLLPT